MEMQKNKNLKNQLELTKLILYNAETFHDGKWVMFNITNNSITEDLKKLLFIKRKPNRK